MIEIAKGLLFPEGPIAMPDGSVLVVEIARGTLSKVLPDGSIQVVGECGGGPNGAAFGPDGRVYVCNNGGFDTEIREGQVRIIEGMSTYVGGSIQAVDLQTGAVETLYTEVEGEPLKGPNDLVFDREGGMWFTDHGKTYERQIDRGGLYYAKPDGSDIKEVVFPLEGPNGVGLSPDEGIVYVAETHVGRLRSWDLAEPGKIAGSFGKTTRGKCVAGLPGDQLLDSLAVDDEGYVCVATIRNGGITEFNPHGGQTRHFPTGDPLTTNICFGGRNMTTAFITCSRSGTLLKTDWHRAGVKLNFNPY